MPHSSGAGLSAFCLVCDCPLTEPFQESQMLIDRNVGLTKTFCHYMDFKQEWDYGFISREFPFCSVCKVSLVELKLLDNEVTALFARIISIKWKLTAKLVESAQNSKGTRGICSRKSRVETQSNSPVTQSDVESTGMLDSYQTIQFSENIYQCVIDLRKSIYQRYDVTVPVSLLDESRLTASSLGKHTAFEPRSEESNPWSYENDVDTFTISPTAVSVSCVEDSENSLNAELNHTDYNCGNIVDFKMKLPHPDVNFTCESGNRCKLSPPFDDSGSAIATFPTEAEFTTEIEVAFKFESKNRSCQSTLPIKDSDIEVPNSFSNIDSSVPIEREEYVESPGLLNDISLQSIGSGSEVENECSHKSDSGSDYSPGAGNDSDDGCDITIKSIGSKHDQETDEPGVHVSDNSETYRSSSSRIASMMRKVAVSFLPQNSSRHREVSPGKWLFDDKFPFEKDGSLFKCCSTDCLGVTFPSFIGVVKHVRRYHCNKKSVRAKPRIRLRQITPSRFLYGGEYNIVLTEGQYTCSACGFHRKAIRKTCEHIRKTHILTITTDKTTSVSKDYSVPSKQSKLSYNQEISPGHWLYHKRYPFDKIDTGFKCGTCLEVCSDFREIVHHVRKLHFKPNLRKKHRMVQIEPNTFLYADKFRVEIIDGRWKCIACQYTTKGKHKMLGHLRTTHINKIETYMCDTCGKVFSRIDSFRNHRLIHEPARPDIICHVCGKGFKSGRPLKQHLLRHERAFECDVCEKKFRTDVNLQAHKSIHSGTKEFMCDRCSQRFQTARGLNCHKKKYCHDKLSGE